MSQHILHILAGLIGHIRKQSKCCNIDKIVIVEPPDITRELLPCSDVLCRLGHAGRYLQTMGKIIRTATRNIADSAALLAFHHPADDLVQCTVPPAADHQFISSLYLFCLRSGIPGRLGNIKRQIKFRFYKNVYDIQQLATDRPFPRLRIHYK